MRIKKTFCCVLAILLCLLAAMPTASASGCDHDYTLVAYQPPRHRAEGYERYRCTRCGDEYEETLDRIPEAPVVWSYDSIGSATSDTLTILVGYYGMSYQQKLVLTLDEILANCDMQTQCFSYINRRPRVCYAVGYGPLLRDVLEYAGVRTGSIQAFQFGTADSGGNFYNQEEWTCSNLYRDRYFYPDLSVYYLADGSFSDSTAARENAEWVEPMLGIWSSWRTYGIGEEFTLSDHSSAMSTDNCFRLLYGQSWIGDASANTSAKWCNAIYIRYAGAPSIDAGSDVQLNVEKNKDGYQLTAAVRAADSQLTALFSDAVRWSSSDESVVRVDAVTGKVTVVGIGTAAITATASFDGVTTSDTITVTVSAEGESTGTGGAGGGTETGGSTGTGTEIGGSTGTGSGAETGGSTGTGSGTETGGSTGTGSGTESGGSTGTDSGTESGSSTGTDSGTESGSSTETGGTSGSRPGSKLPDRSDGAVLAPIRPEVTPLRPEVTPLRPAADTTAGTAQESSGNPTAQPADTPESSAHGTLKRIRTPEREESGTSGGGTELTLLRPSSVPVLIAAAAALLLGGILKYLQYRKQIR